MSTFMYFVEGECEEKLINEFKRQTDGFIPGKVTVFNVINKEISSQRIASIKKNTTVILVYDTDVPRTECLEKNIKKLQKFRIKVVHIQSIKDFEDEMVYSTSLKKIDDMYKTIGKEEFKKKFIHQNNLVEKMKSIDFNIDKIWSRENESEPFKKYSKKDDFKSIKTKK